MPVNFDVFSSIIIIAIGFLQINFTKATRLEINFAKATLSCKSHGDPTYAVEAN